MRRRDAIEWVVLGISVLAIAAVTLVLVVEALGEVSPADPRVEVHEADGRQGTLGWIIPLTITNDGDQSVESVVLEATATVDGQEETSEIELPFLPARTELQAEVAFSTRPEEPITVRLVGFRLP